jgi:hypothetical protein
MEKEIVWREIPEFNGKYFVSNTGKVKSLFFGKEKIITPGLNRGYETLGLTDKNKVRRTFKVHRLVALVFIENNDPKKKIEIHHKDGNILNNNADNLEWCTHMSNCQKDYIAGRRKNQKNTVESIKKIREMYQTKKYSQRELCKIFNLKQSAICDILNRKKWGYVD